MSKLYIFSARQYIKFRAGAAQVVIPGRDSNGTLFLPALPALFWSPPSLPSNWVPEARFPGIKRPGREAYHTPTSSAKIRNAWSYTSTRSYVFTTWWLIK